MLFRSKLRHFREVVVRGQQLRAHRLGEKHELRVHVFTLCDFTLGDADIEVLDLAQLVQDLEAAPSPRLLVRIY